MLSRSSLQPGFGRLSAQQVDDMKAPNSTGGKFNPVEKELQDNLTSHSNWVPQFSLIHNKEDKLTSILLGVQLGD